MTWHCLSTLTWVCLTFSKFFLSSVHEIILTHPYISFKVHSYVHAIMIFSGIYFTGYLENMLEMCIHMHACMYLFCMYATHMYVCIYAHKHVWMCVYACIWACVCICMCVYVCILCVCMCALSVPVYLHACLCSPTNLSSGCIYIHCHQWFSWVPWVKTFCLFFNIYQSSLLTVLLHHLEQLWIVRTGDPWHYVF